MLVQSVQLSLPSWLKDHLERQDMFILPRDERMRFVIRMAKKNVDEQTGGPFAAGVFCKETGQLIAVGLNVVVASNCSVAHAEAMALMLAQQQLQSFDLGVRNLELVTSAQPCIQCFGVTYWSGIKGLIIAATADDVERLTADVVNGKKGFDEGPVPADWPQKLEAKGISVTQGVLRDESCQVLRSYAHKGGTIYQGSTCRGHLS